MKFRPKASPASYPPTGMQPAPDVSSQQITRGGLFHDFVLPVMFAAALGLGVAWLFLECFEAIRHLRASAFWVIALVICGGHIVWVVVFGYKWEDWQLSKACVQGLLFSALGGWFAMALNQVLYTYDADPVTIARPLGVAVFVCVLFVALFQESLYRSPFVEKAMMLLLTQKDRPHWREADEEVEEELPPPRPLPPRWTVQVVDERPTDANHSRGIRNHDFKFLTPQVMYQLAVLDQQRVALSEPQMCVERKAFSPSLFRRIQGELLEVGWWAWENEEAHNLGGYWTEEGGQALEQALAELGGNGHTPPTPPPQEDEWAFNAV